MRKLNSAVNLEHLLFNALYAKSIEGYRALSANGFRLSKFGDCSLELFWDKIKPVPAPPAHINLMKDPYTGVISVPAGKALTGTIMHMGIQTIMDEHITGSEEFVEREFIDAKGRGAVLLSGHIDMTYINEHGDPECNDIKSTGTKQFKDIAGILNMAPGSYSDLKEQKALAQANAYAYIKEESRFTITWVDRGDNELLHFKIDVYETDSAEFHDTMEKLYDVMRAVKEYEEGNHAARPVMAGICMCSYCDHFNMNCLGRDRIDQLGYIP